MVSHTCARCSSSSEDAKRCAGCREVWYCSAECQTDHWMFHIFDCKPDKPISTVYHLIRACHGDIVPVDDQTRKDYGFEKAQRLLGDSSGAMLLGLYQTIFDRLGVAPKEVRKWKDEGRLMGGIQAAFESAPPQHKGQFYSWLLDNQFVLDDTPVDEAQEGRFKLEASSQMSREEWIFTGGSPDASLQEIEAAILACSFPTRLCHQLYRILLTGAHPSPRFESGVLCWISFGFVAATTEKEEHQYGEAYRTLIRRCTFNEFSAAFGTTALPALFERCGLSVPNPHLFSDVLSGSPNDFKSVWYLKHYVDLVVASSSDSFPDPLPHVLKHYGFVNCKSQSERKLLDDLYVELLTKTQADPLELHGACVKGELLEYVKRFVKLSPWTAKYTRLLKNPYPLLGFAGPGVALAHVHWNWPA